MRDMHFVTLVKMRRPVTREDAERVDKTIQRWVARGNKIHSAFFTLGGYDQVWLWESVDERTAMQSVMEVSDIAATETFPAIGRDEVDKWIGH